MEVVWCEVGSMGARFKWLSRGVRGDTVTHRGQPYMFFVGGVWSLRRWVEDGCM